jgi:hypothetical protein
LEILSIRLRNTGLKDNFSKCEFGAANVSYLGYRLTPDGILQVSNKLRAIRESKAPNTVQEISNSCASAIFWSHVSNFITISATLNRLTSKEANWKGVDLPESCMEPSLKKTLISQPIGDYPSKHRPSSLIVDTSTGADKLIVLL